jgi:hypothetical protein
VLASRPKVIVRIARLVINAPLMLM